VNQTSVVVKVRLGSHLSAILEPGASATFPRSLDAYLAPGNHMLALGSTSAADIWVDPICTGPHANDCSPSP
jgi:alpha-D-ribose 1-methylphosphonate 5-triphosphate synthase subunit PhnH